MTRRFIDRVRVSTVEECEAIEEEDVSSFELELQLYPSRCLGDSLQSVELRLCKFRDVGVGHAQMRTETVGIEARK